MIVQEILDELEISEADYYWALSISKDEDLLIPVFNEHKPVTYMCQYFSKTENRCSKAMKQAAKKIFDSNMHHHDTMKAIARGYLGTR